MATSSYSPSGGADRPATIEDRPISSPEGGGPRAWLLPTTRPAAAWIETVVISLAAFAIGWLADRNDPLGVGASFPWVWFAPVLVALRYGVVPGVMSAAILIGAWYVWSLAVGAPDAALPKLQFLGGLLLTLVCAEYGAAWRGRVRRAEEMSGYLDERLERVTRRLFLLRLSHERLEQELLSQPTTLRDALAQMRLRVLSAVREGGRDGAANDTPSLPGAQALLAFLAQHCQLESAALHVAEPAAGEQAFRTVARIGAPPELAPNDPLLAYVLDNGSLGHVQTERPELVPTPQLVIAPVQASEGTLLGVLSVGRMPFFALNQDTLQLLAVLLGAYADMVKSGPQLARINKTLPDAPEEFTEELARLSRIQRELGIDSHIVVFLFGDHEQALDAHALLVRQRRAPDVAWINPPAPRARAAFANILPISGKAAVDGYLLRTESSLKQSFGADFAALNVRPVVIPLSDADPAATLSQRLGASAK